MDIRGYISILERYKHLGSDIGDRANEILTEFLYAQHLSTYMVYSKFRDHPGHHKIAYKNIHKRIKRLESLEFIEPVKTKNTKHGAIFYRISEAGMFQLFIYRIYPILASFLHSILVNNGNYSIFETFLYPYFRKETLTVTEPNYAIRLAIVNYLNSCCTAAHSLTTSYEEHNSLEAVEGYISGLKNELVMKILILFGFYTKGKGMDDLPILAKDDKFMKVADDVHKHFKRSFDIALALRNRS
jgi:hypothetical protein